MSIFIHIVLFIPLTMAAGAYVWEKRVWIKGALAAQFEKLKSKSGS